MQQPRQHIFRILIVLFSVIAFGIIGYMAIEGWSFLDAIYMTVITLSTVGYAEVKVLSTAGRIFSIVLIVVGVGGMLYTLTTIVRYFIEGQLANILGRRRMAMLTLRPLVVDFIDTTIYSRSGEMIIENIEVGASSPVVRVTLKEAIERCGAVSILAVRGKDGSLLDHPQEEILLELGDELVVIGTREQLRVLEGSVQSR